MDSFFITMFEIQVILNILCCLTYLSKSMYERLKKQVELELKRFREEESQSQKIE